jgi:FkbM family methyltransferase
MLIKIKGFIPTKLKTYLKKFKNFNGYNDLDKKMLKYLNYKNGFFVDIGANDGVNQSTTWYFEKKLNWRGILIEPLPHIYNELIKNRSKENYFYNCAAVSKFYKKDRINLSYDSDTLRTKFQFLEEEKNKKIVRVKAQTITNILKKTISSEKIIDFFSLDVEGAEFEVLNGIDYNRNCINYFLIETSNSRKLKSFLTKKKFKFVSRLSNYNIPELPDYGDYLFKNNNCL